MMKGKATGVGATFNLFLSLTLGGIGLGLLFGALCTIWIKKIFNDEVLVVNITFLTCYLVSFFKFNSFYKIITPNSYFILLKMLI